MESPALLSLQPGPSNQDAQNPIAGLSPFRAAFAQAAVGMAITDLEGRFLEVNAALCQATEYQQEELLQTGAFAITHPDDRARMSALILEMLSGKISSFVMEKRCLKKSGGHGWLRTSMSPMRDSQGRPERILILAEEITEVVLGEEGRFRRRHDELGTLSVSAALLESEERFRCFFDLAAVGMTQSDIPSGRYIAVNQKFADITGYTREELLQKSYADLTHPQDREANLLLYRQLMDNAIPEFSYEKRYLRKDGEAVWVHTTASAVRDADGAPLYTVAVVEDITERKEAEQSLRESEERFRTLAESLPQLVWTCLPNGECDYLSRQWVAYTGVAEDCQLGLEWLPRVIHPADRRRTLEAWMSAVEDKAAYDIEYRIRRFDGAYRWFKTRGTPLRDGAGRILRWFGTCTDIEDQRRTTEALRRSNEELRRANEDLNQFAFSASHDLKEPLRMIAIYAQLLQRKYQAKLNAQAQEYIEQVVSGARRMEMLVNDLLEYTQIVNVPLADIAPMEVGVAIRKAISNLETAVEESGAKIEVDQLPCVAVREAHLLQLFQNLISNALKYRSAAAPRIQITAEREEHGWKMCVRDNGIGIDPAYHAQIFRIFRRLHANRDYPGTGIGLAICQKIVERYGGTIWVESEGENKGAAFCFTLPAELSASQAGANSLL